MRKLRQLVTVAEPQGEFWAPVPGSDKQSVYPSTIAYVATLILHRLRVLGLVDEQGAKGVSNVRAIRSVEPAPVKDANAALDCPECRAVGTYILSGGCPTCSECGFSKCS